jgi:REase_MTES_1575
MAHQLKAWKKICSTKPKARPPNWRCWIKSEWEFRTFQNGHDRFVVVPQFSIAEVGPVDFAIFVPQVGADEPILVIEVDGHDFHERTPEQASEDNGRDRVLQRLGIPFFRFTATDVVRRSADAAREIAQFVDFKLREATARRAEEEEPRAEYYELQCRRAGVL